MNRLRLLSTLVCFLICSDAVFAQGNTPKPLDQLSAGEKETYARLLQEYKTAESKRDNLLKEAKKTDPTFERAAYWLDNLRLKASTKSSQLEKKYLSANADKKNDYRRWSRGYSTSVRNETLKKEWNDVPSARRALLFLAEKKMAIEKQKAKGRKTRGDAQKAGDVTISELKGSDAEKWNQFLAYSSRRYGNFSIDYDVDALERGLRIPTDLKSELRKQVADGALVFVYESYYQAHMPPEVATLRKQIAASVSELNALRPGWEVAEGIRGPAPNGKGMSEQLPKRGPSYLLSGICLTLIVVLSAIFILRRRTKR